MAPELEDYWFEHRGSGWCQGTKVVSWKGWLVTGLYAGLLTAVALLLAERSLVGFFAIMALMTAAFLVLVASKTRGGLLGGWKGAD